MIFELASNGFKIQARLFGPPELDWPMRKATLPMLLRDTRHVLSRSEQSRLRCARSRKAWTSSVSLDCRNFSDFDVSEVFSRFGLSLRRRSATLLSLLSYILFSCLSLFIDANVLILLCSASIRSVREFDEF